MVAHLFLGNIARHSKGVSLLHGHTGQCRCAWAPRLISVHGPIRPGDMMEIGVSPRKVLRPLDLSGPTIP